MPRGSQRPTTDSVRRRNLHVTAGGGPDLLRTAARQRDKIRWLGFERNALLAAIPCHVDDVVEEEGHPRAHRVDRGQAVIEPLRVRRLAPPQQSLQRLRMELDRVQRAAQIVRDRRQHLFPNLIGLELSGDVAHDGKTDRTGGEIEPPRPDLDGNARAVTAQELALGARLSRFPEPRDLGFGLVWAGENVHQAHGEQGVQVIAEHPAGGRVGFDKAAARVDNENRIRNTLEQTAESDLCFFGLETRGPLGVIQSCVVDRERGASGQLLRQLEVSFVVAMPGFGGRE